MIRALRHSSVCDRTSCTVPALRVPCRGQGRGLRPHDRAVSVQSLRSFTRRALPQKSPVSVRGLRPLTRRGLFCVARGSPNTEYRIPNTKYRIPCGLRRRMHAMHTLLALANSVRCKVGLYSCPRIHARRRCSGRRHATPGARAPVIAQSPSDCCGFRPNSKRRPVTLRPRLMVLYSISQPSF